MHKNVRLVNKVDIASRVMAIVTSVVAMGGIYYYTAVMLGLTVSYDYNVSIHMYTYM